MNKTKLTPEIFVQLGFNQHDTLITSFYLVIEDKVFHEPLRGDKAYYIYKAISCTLCNDKGNKEYYLMIREGSGDNNRFNDEIITVTRNLQYKEDLEQFINIVKL